MTAALRSEFRKLLSTRLWWILALAMVAYVAFISVALGAAFSAEPSTGSSALDTARQIYALANGYGYPFAVVVGAMLFTAEYRHRTITPTLLAEPRRSVLLGAKLTAAAAIGAGFGVIASATAAVAGGAALQIGGVGGHLGSGSVWAVLVGNVVALALWTMLGAAFGGVVVNQVVAIVAVIVFAQFVEPLLRIGLASWHVTRGVSKFLPGSATDAVSGSSFYSQLVGSGGLLDRWQGVLVMLGYVAVLALVARYVTLRRDVS